MSEPTPEPTPESTAWVDRTAVAAAAALVREYVDTGGQAYEIIRADRFLQAALDAPGPDRPTVPEALRSSLATIREHHRVERLLGEAAQRGYVTHVGILLEVIDALAPSEANGA